MARSAWDWARNKADLGTMLRMTTPDYGTQPRKFLEHLYAVAVRRAMPLQTRRARRNVVVTRDHQSR